MDKAATELDGLCAGEDASPSSIRTLFANWEDPPGCVQPKALAWFNDTNAVESASERNNLGVLHMLLVKGLHATIVAE